MLPMAISSGWASGINAYLIVALLGLLGRYGGVESVPDALTRTDVLVVAGILLCVEFVADKIPYVDSTWDAISTAIRPTIGAALGLLLAGEASSVEQATLAAVGGTTALLSHLTKAGLRLAINGSPEPVSNVVVSTGEDISVAGVALLMLSYPWLAAAIAMTLLITGMLMLFLVGRLVRRGWRRWKGKEPAATRLDRT
jgi:Domain of unknown function (DUF4126)